MSLTALFTDIANAIRAKDGTTANIAASAFPGRISAIPTGADTSDATVSAADIISGKTAYGKDGKITGTMPEAEGATITPGKNAQIAIAAGSYAKDDILVEGDANLMAANIVINKTIFGVKGAAVTHASATLRITTGSSSPGITHLIATNTLNSAISQTSFSPQQTYTFSVPLSSLLCVGASTASIFNNATTSGLQQVMAFNNFKVYRVAISSPTITFP